VRFLCDVYGVSKSGFYTFLQRPMSDQQKRRNQLATQIIGIYDENRGIYGSPRVHRQLHKQGQRCCKNTVASIMREFGLKGRVSRVYANNAGLHKFYTKVGNLRLGKPLPKSINQVWVGDVTYIKVKKRFQYLAAVMDLYSRTIVGWSFGNNRKKELTKRALLHAVRKRRPSQGLRFHSDRGVEYRCDEHTRVLSRHNIIHSANRPRCCQDNAHMESFFHTLKGELIRGRSIESEKELRQLVNGYIIHFYISKDYTQHLITVHRLNMNGRQANRRRSPLFVGKITRFPRRKALALYTMSRLGKYN
jgi:putative transposase